MFNLNKKNVAIVALLALVLTQLRGATIINDTGNFDGEIEADEKSYGWFSDVDERAWVQAGANSKSGSGHFIDGDFYPEISTEGPINNVNLVDLLDDGTIVEGGPVCFATSKEIADSSKGNSITTTMQNWQDYGMGFKLPSSATATTVPLTVHQNISVSWSESTTDTVSCSSTSGSSSSGTVSGSIGFPSVNLGASCSHTITNAVTNEYLTTTGKTLSGSTSITSSFGPINIPLEPGQSFVIQQKIVKYSQTGTVLFHPDGNIDGISDTSTPYSLTESIGYTAITFYSYRTFYEGIE